jgi:hypothetical protein
VQIDWSRSCSVLRSGLISPAYEKRQPALTAWNRHFNFQGGSFAALRLSWTIPASLVEIDELKNYPAKSQRRKETERKPIVSKLALQDIG